jgi:hypothetical protein
MEIASIAAWGELIGGIAVVVSLVYLASQVRQNSKLLEASTTAATNQLRLEVASSTSKDPELVQIWYEGLADPDSLSQVQWRQFGMLLTVQFQADSQQYQFHRDGIGSSMAWDHILVTLRWYVQQPGWRKWYDQWRFNFGEDFCNFLDGLIEEVDAAAHPDRARGLL